MEVYDPMKPSRKRYVGSYDTQQEARGAARLAESELAARRGRGGDTTVAQFAARWLDLHPRQKESTNVGYAQQVRPFVDRYGALPLRDVTVHVALEWARERRWTLGGVRAMFSDARRRGLVDTNPFTNLRHKLKAGHYEAKLSAKDPAGNSSHTKTKTFTL